MLDTKNLAILESLKKPAVTETAESQKVSPFVEICYTHPIDGPSYPTLPVKDVKSVRVTSFAQ